MHDLGAWLEEDYERSFRAACLILHNRADAEEAVQEAFLRAWRFRSSMPEGEGVRPWLYRVVVNTCCSRLRKDRPEREGSVHNGWEALHTVAASSPSPESAAVSGDVSKLVGQVLAELPEHLRVAVVLRYWAGLNEREIATAIRRRPGTVKSRLHEARRRLSEDPRLGALVAETADGGTP